jgi:putative oxidoreductase
MTAAQEATLGYIASSGLPFPVVALWGAVAVELLGGLALAAGFHARLAAIALAGFSLVAALFFHAAFGDQNQMIHFLKNIAIAGGLLQVAAFGAGSVSIDALRDARAARSSG